MDEKILDQWKRWSQEQLEDPDLSEELKEIGQNEMEITDRFYKSLEFGTGGLRGVIGAGTNRMNIYTVGQATAGYASYLRQNFQTPSVAIAYDSRIKSSLFAQRAACVLAANGIRVYLYKELMPTPSLSFAVRRLKCSGGIVITASHNPAKYNGYKVYGSDGGQITTDTAKRISDEIAHVDPFCVCPVVFEQALIAGLIAYVEEDTVTAYLQAVSDQLFSGDEIDRDISIVYTPLNGSGLRCVTRALKENGFTNVIVVSEQEEPDGNFPTCPYPNPEMRETLELGLQYMRERGSDLLLATDPDCDRVGMAVRNDGDYILLTGNEVGLLLFDYICKRRIALKVMPSAPILVKTVVTTDLVKPMAQDYGVEVIDVLTGFKFIGEQIGLLEQRSEAERYIFGFEESCGYLSGSFVRDKDAVNASLLICEMAAYYKARGTTMIEVLNAIYKRYGYCLNTLQSYEFEGADGFCKMNQIMEKFRISPPTVIGGKKVEGVSDFEKSLTVMDNGTNIPISLPKSNVIKFLLVDQCSLVIRPSGTEPKLKLYMSVSAKSKRDAQSLEKWMVKELEQIILPKKRKFIPISS